MSWMQDSAVERAALRLSEARQVVSACIKLDAFDLAETYIDPFDVLGDLIDGAFRAASRRGYQPHEIAVGLIDLLCTKFFRSAHEPRILGRFAECRNTSSRKVNVACLRAPKKLPRPLDQDFSVAGPSEIALRLPPGESVWVPIHYTLGKNSIVAVSQLDLTPFDFGEWNRFSSAEELSQCCGVFTYWNQERLNKVCSLCLQDT
jgi:hypothetical protein